MKTPLKTAVASLAAAGALLAVSPAIASADPIDDALNALPSGQISCEQAEQYWTTEAQYDTIRAQAQAVALFDSRGAEINDALDRVDEAAHRCGLTGDGAPAGGTDDPAPGNPAPGAPAPGNPAPAPAPAGNVIEIPAPAGTPTIDVPVADVVTFRIPDLAAVIRAFLDSLNIPFLPAGSSF